MAAKINKAVIPVAGLGTRMLPATKAIPKELLPVHDRPIIEHVVTEAIAGGVTEIILVTRSGKEAIENHFDAHYELEHRLEKKERKPFLGLLRISFQSMSRSPLSVSLMPWAGSRGALCQTSFK